MRKKVLIIDSDGELRPAMVDEANILPLDKTAPASTPQQTTQADQTGQPPKRKESKKTMVNRIIARMTEMDAQEQPEHSARKPVPAHNRAANAIPSWLAELDVSKKPKRAANETLHSQNRIFILMAFGLTLILMLGLLFLMILIMRVPL